MRKITLLGALLLFAIQSYSQTDCAKTLKKAQAAYDDGLLEKIPKMLTPCIKAEAFLEEDLVQAYKLMTLAYIFDERYEKADSSMRLFLKEEPEYEINTTIDPPEFVNLYNSFRTHPLFSFGIVAGANMTIKRDIKNFSVLNTESGGNSEFSTRNIINYVAGLSGSYYFSKRLEANLEVLVIGRNLETTEEGGGIEAAGFSKTVASETQTWLEIPITAVYTLGNKKLKPYVRLGGSIGFLFFSNINFERTFTDDDLSIPNRSLDYSEDRNSINYWLHGGLGLKYKIKNGHLMLDVRYCHGLFNQVAVNNRYESESARDAEATFNYIDNDFKLSNVNISLGFFQYIYSPKKLKQKK